MKTFTSRILCALFSLFAASQTWAQDIVGAWTRGDTTKKGSSVIVFLADGRLYNIDTAAQDGRPGFDGVEAGTYTWNPANGALTVTLRHDGNGDLGVGRLQSVPGTFTLSGDSGTLAIPGFRTDTLTRVINAGPIIGAWSDSAGGAVVFLANGVYFQTDGEGMQCGGYSSGFNLDYLNARTSPALCIDTIKDGGLGYWGHLYPSPSADGSLRLVYSEWWGGGGGAFALVRVGAEIPTAANYQGMWAVPNRAEAGWGINFTHQGDLIFASWFTYDASGKPRWLTMTAQQQADGSFAGPIDRTSGPPFSAAKFDSAQVAHATVGTGRLAFTDANNGEFAYTVSGISQIKSLRRFQFGFGLPICTFDHPSLLPRQTSNYQDMWVVANHAEEGWGLNLTHQDGVLFASWFTYDADGNPLWMTSTLTPGKTVWPSYFGEIDATTGPAFDAVPFDPSRVTHKTVGTALLLFLDGANARFTYQLDGVSQIKELTRFVFRAPGTVCH